MSIRATASANNAKGRPSNSPRKVSDFPLYRFSSFIATKPSKAPIGIPKKKNNGFIFSPLEKRVY